MENFNVEVIGSPDPEDIELNSILRASSKDAATFLLKQGRKDPKAREMIKGSDMGWIFDKRKSELLSYAEEQQRITETIQREIIPGLTESFKKDLISYLKKLNIEYDEVEIINRINNTNVFVIDDLRQVATTLVSNSIYGFFMPDLKYTRLFHTQRTSAIILNLQKIIGKHNVSISDIKDNEEFISNVKSIFYHEMCHAISSSNLWKISEANEEAHYTIPRRSGISTKPLNTTDARRDTETRLTPLNEAITHHITGRIIEYASESQTRSTQKDIDIVYLRERKVLEVLCELVDWNFLVVAYTTTEGLRTLNRLLKERYDFTLKDLNALMKKDEEENYPKLKGYEYTIDFLRKKLPLGKKILYRFKSRNYTSKIKINE